MSTKRAEARRIADLREKLLPAALRMIWTQRVIPAELNRPYVPLTDEHREAIAAEALQLAHSIAQAAVVFDEITREE